MPKNIMLIEDSAFDRLIAVKVIELSKKAETCLTYDTAIKALEHLRNPSCMVPDLILLDLNMPEMNGFDFLEEFKKLQQERQLDSKVIIVSSSSHPEDHQKTMQYDCVIGYILKPLTLQKVLDSPLFE